MNKEGNIVQDKSLKFVFRIINSYKYLKEVKKEYVLSNQILRSGTSIGANIEEAIGGQSKKDFFAKICIAYKEARETAYWLKLLKRGNFIKEKDFYSIFDNCEELCKLLASIKITLKNNS